MEQCPECINDGEWHHRQVETMNWRSGNTLKYNAAQNVMNGQQYTE